jgi:hypothetical protein
MFAGDFGKSPASKKVDKIDNVYMIGEAVCVIIDSTFDGYIGHLVEIYVPDASADLWKIRTTFVSY